MAEIKMVYQPVQRFSDPHFANDLLHYKSAEAMVICQAVVNTSVTVAVTIASKVRVPSLNDNTFFQVEIIQKNGSDEHLVESLLESTFSCVRNQLQKGGGQAIGLIYAHRTVAGDVKTLLSQARFYLFGFSKAGEPLYVKYFKGVRI